MAKRVYDDQDRARVYAALAANGGNIKRTARELDIPVATVRDWKIKWTNGEVPPEITEVLPAVIADFVEDATRVRNKLLLRLEKLVDRGDLTAREIVPALGMLQDKIRAYQGVEKRQVEHTFELPSPAKLQELFAGVFTDILTAASDRAVEIEDAVWEESVRPTLDPAADTEVTPSARI